MFNFNILKNLVKKIKNIKYQKTLLNSLNPGDLVWAKMPLSKRELKTVAETHRIRPYLVISKDSMYIYAYQSSSKLSDKLNNYEQYFINRLRYKQNKDSFLNLTKIHKIPWKNLRDKYITLSSLDVSNIQKRLQLQGSIYRFSIDTYIIDGDVIKIDNKLYFVYASDNVYLYCLLIFKKCPRNNQKYEKIIINNKNYYSTFKEKNSFKRTTKMDIVDIAYSNEIEKILELKNTLRYNNKHQIHMQDDYKISYDFGSIFEVGKNKVVYLFTYKNIHFGVDLLMYQIKPRLIPIYNIKNRPVIEILDLERYVKIVESLSLKNVRYVKKINKLYDELRVIV